MLSYVKYLFGYAFKNVSLYWLDILYVDCTLEKYLILRELGNKKIDVGVNGFGIHGFAKTIEKIDVGVNGFAKTIVIFM